MKQSEIIPRQNRVVYVLMILVAIAALFWAIREHAVHTETPEQLQREHHISSNDTAGKSVITVRTRSK